LRRYDGNNNTTPGSTGVIPAKLRPRDDVNRRAMELMAANPGMSYGDAYRLVLDTDPALKNAFARDV